MVIIGKVNGKNEISNEIGLQLIGSPVPNQEGLNPKELMEAALGLCVSISLDKMLERDNVFVKDGDISIMVVSTKNEAGKNKFDQMEVDITFPAHFTKEYKQKLLVSVERACTIGNSFKNGMTINTVEHLV